VRQPISQFAKARPPPARAAKYGATTQAINAIGSAAAAQTANTCHREYCGMG
jgi:hypothetical protein